MLRLMDPDIFAFTGILLSTVVRQVFCRPKGGRRGASVAVYGGRGSIGRSSFASARWAVLSPATKVLVLIFCALLGIFVMVGLYRAYIWCTRVPGRR